jgi:hypothetical protein
MRKIILVLILAFIVTTIFAEVKEKKTVFVVSLTTGLFSGYNVGLGFTNIYDDKAWEHTVNYQNALVSHVAKAKITWKPIDTHHFDSINYQANRFWNSEREKSFLILNCGVTFMPAMAIGMSGIDTDWVLPILSVGYGYSLKINKIYLRPSIDLGIQLSVATLKFAIIY